jgi:hypothetical protein
MYSVGSFAPTVAPLPSQSFSAPVASAQPSLGNIPAQSVPSAIANPELRNNTRPRQQAALAPLPNATVLAAQAASSASTSARGGLLLNASAPFFAQMLAQGNAVEASYSPPNILQPETMEAYSNTKYMPSNAFKPSPPPPRFVATAAPAAPPPQAVISQPATVSSPPPVAAPVVTAPAVQTAIQMTLPLRPVATSAPAPSVAKQDSEADPADTPDSAPLPKPMDISV